MMRSNLEGGARRRRRQATAEMPSVLQGRRAIRVSNWVLKRWICFGYCSKINATVAGNENKNDVFGSGFFW